MEVDIVSMISGSNGCYQRPSSGRLYGGGPDGKESVSDATRKQNTFLGVFHDNNMKIK